MKKTLTICLNSFLLIIFLLNAHGETISSELHIRAAVPPIVEFRVLFEPDHINISKTDIRRGEIMVENGTVVQVRSNSRDGYLLTVQAQSADLYKSVTVKVAGDDRAIDIPSGGSIDFHVPFSGTKKNIKILEYTFQLSNAAIKGKYYWPIAVSVHPL